MTVTIALIVGFCAGVCAMLVVDTGVYNYIIKPRKKKRVAKVIGFKYDAPKRFRKNSSDSV